MATELDRFLGDFAQAVPNFLASDVQLGLGTATVGIAEGLDFDFMSLTSQGFASHGILGSAGEDAVLQLSSPLTHGDGGEHPQTWARPKGVFSEGDEAFDPQRILQVLDDDDPRTHSAPSNSKPGVVLHNRKTNGSGLGDELVLLALGADMTDPKAFCDELVALAVGDPTNRPPHASSHNPTVRRNLLRRYFSKRPSATLDKTRNAEPVNAAALAALCLQPRIGGAAPRAVLPEGASINVVQPLQPAASPSSGAIVESLEALCCATDGQRSVALERTEARDVFHHAFQEGTTDTGRDGKAVTLQELAGICFGEPDASNKPTVLVEETAVSTPPKYVPASVSEPTQAAPVHPTGGRSPVVPLLQLFRNSLADGKQFATTGYQTPYYAASQHLTRLIEKGTALYGRKPATRKGKQLDVAVELELERLLLSGYLFGVALNMVHLSQTTAVDMAEAAVKLTQTSNWRVETLATLGQHLPEAALKTHFRFVANCLATIGMLFEHLSWCIANCCYTLARRRAAAVGAFNAALDRSLVDGQPFVGRDAQLGSEVSAAALVILAGDSAKAGGGDDVPDIALPVFPLAI